MIGARFLFSVINADSETEEVIAKPTRKPIMPPEPMENNVGERLSILMDILNNYELDLAVVVSDYRKKTLFNFPNPNQGKNSSLSKICSSS